MPYSVLNDGRGHSHYYCATKRQAPASLLNYFIGQYGNGTDDQTVIKLQTRIKHSLNYVIG